MKRFDYRVAPSTSSFATSSRTPSTSSSSGRSTRRPRRRRHPPAEWASRRRRINDIKPSSLSLTKLPDKLERLSFAILSVLYLRLIQGAYTWHHVKIPYITIPKLIKIPNICTNPERNNPKTIYISIQKMAITLNSFFGIITCGIVTCRIVTYGINT
jgi:hypothetical protein